MLFLVKLGIIHNTPPGVFLTFLNEANCPKSQTKITRVKRKLYALCISSIAIFEQRIQYAKYAGIRFSLTRIFLCNGKIVNSVLIRENTGHRKPVFSHILHRG